MILYLYKLFISDKLETIMLYLKNYRSEDWYEWYTGNDLALSPTVAYVQSGGVYITSMNPTMR